MTDPNVVMTPPPPQADVYRPISLLAIGGLCLGVVYCAIVVATTLIALLQGATFFLPGWMIIVALAGAVVSYLGLRHISNSEGTRAGVTLARWGLWLSVIPGLGYTAYTYFTGLALAQQANDFLMTIDEDSGFLARLQEGTVPEANAAFLLAMPYSMRAGINPSDDAAMRKQFDIAPDQQKEGFLTQFRDHVVVRLLRDFKKNAAIEPLGVQEWKYQDRAYVVVRNYRITTPEFTVELSIPVASSERDAEGRRKWAVMFDRLQIVGAGRVLSEFGEAVEKGRLASKSAVSHWLRTVKDVFRDDTDYAALALPEGERQKLQERVKTLFARGDVKAEPMPSRDPYKGAAESLANGGLRLAHDYMLMLGPTEKDFSAYKCKARISVQTKKRFDPHGASRGEWEVTKFEIVRADPIGMPGMPGMPGKMPEGMPFGKN